MSWRSALKHLLAWSVAKAVPRWVFLDHVLFSFWERQGLHLTPVHYSQPIPDTRTLDPALWERPSELPGIDLREERQVELVQGLGRDFGGEIAELRRDPGGPAEFFLDNPSFGTPDAEFYYGMIRRFRPKRIIEIGSGNSTLLGALTLLKNAEQSGELGTLTAIDPYPNKYVCDGFPGLHRLITTKVQDLPLEEFAALGDGDILFIDSSHILTIGSDVQYEFLEILPRLAKGVLIHVHDVHLPYEYKRKWVTEFHAFFNESYLLQAFLAFSAAFEVLLAGAYLHYRRPDLLREVIPAYQGQLPGSFWIRRMA
jgi:hypothetical protein